MPRGNFGTVAAGAISISSPADAPVTGSTQGGILMREARGLARGGRWVPGLRRQEDAPQTSRMFQSKDGVLHF